MNPSTPRDHDEKKVLIIDDDEEICEEMAEILTDEGYAVTLVNNGIDGKRSLEEGGYDVAILDLKMPGLSGYDVLKSIKSNSSVKTRVLVISGRPFIKKYMPGDDKSDKQQKEDLLKLADGFVNKPFDVDLVLEKIHELTA